jgi:hypothetical protein
MKNHHRFKIPVPSGPRFRWVLPNDLREVKLLAFQQGVINATEERKQGKELSQEAREAGSIEAALLWEKEVKAGRVGCNQPVTFRKTFSDMCTRIHQSMYSYWLESPEVYKNFVHRPPQQRELNARQIAELYLDTVEHKIAANEPIVFTWE